MRSIFVALVLCAAACSSSSTGGHDVDGGGCASSVTAAPGLVVTASGPVQGSAESDTWAYRGIPYAAPPVGALRWQAPQDPACWSQPLAASAFGSACVQLDASGAVIGNEDCLTIERLGPDGGDGDEQAARPVLRARRRQHARFERRVAQRRLPLRRRAPRRANPERRRHLQLSPRAIRLSRALVAGRRRTRRRQLRHARSDRGAALGRSATSRHSAAIRRASCCSANRPARRTRARWSPRRSPRGSSRRR